MDPRGASLPPLTEATRACSWLSSVQLARGLHKKPLINPTSSLRIYLASTSLPCHVKEDISSSALRTTFLSSSQGLSLGQVHSHFYLTLHNFRFYGTTVSWVGARAEHFHTIPQQISRAHSVSPYTAISVLMATSGGPNCFALVFWQGLVTSLCLDACSGLV